MLPSISHITMIHACSDYGINPIECFFDIEGHAAHTLMIDIPGDHFSTYMSP